MAGTLPLELDVDGFCAEPAWKVRRQAISPPERPEGPKNLTDALEIAKPMAQAIAAEMRRLDPTAGIVQGRTWHRVVLTTSFTGMDFPRTALHQLQHFLQADFGLTLKVKYFCGIDPCSSARQITLAKSACQRPEHFFDSVWLGVPASVQQELLQAQGALRQSITDQSANVPQAEASAAKKLWQRVLGEQFAAQARARLRQLDMKMYEQAWCAICHRMCPACPEIQPGELHLEIAGTLCRPYSRMNQHAWGLLSPDALAMMVWAERCRQRGCHRVLHENALAFPTHILSLALSTPQVPTSAGTATFGSAAAVESSPRDFGLPKQRARQYARWKLEEPGAQPIPPDAPIFEPACLARLFFRRVATTTQIYLRATAAEVHQHYVERARACKLELSKDEFQGSQGVPVEDVIPPCARVHLRYCSQLHQQSLAQESSTQALDIVRLMQSPCRVRPSPLAPAMLTHSLLYSLVSARLLLPAECMLLQGIPAKVGAELSPETLALSPWRGLDLADVLGAGSLHKLLGNGMDMGQVTSAIALLLMEAMRS